VLPIPRSIGRHEESGKRQQDGATASRPFLGFRHRGQAGELDAHDLQLTPLVVTTQPWLTTSQRPLSATSQRSTFDPSTTATSPNHLLAHILPWLGAQEFRSRLRT
jgi:hypothetical protein